MFFDDCHRVVSGSWLLCVVAERRLRKKSFFCRQENIAKFANSVR